MTASDSGKFTCKVENSAESIEFTFKISVFEIARTKSILVKRQCTNQTKHVGDSKTLSVLTQ